MPTIINGLVGGLVATVVMTGVMLALGDDSPPLPAFVWSTYIGGGTPEQFRRQGIALHFLYGSVAGGLFVPGAAVLKWGFEAAAQVFLTAGTFTIIWGPGWGLLWGLCWGSVLFVIATVCWRKAILDMEIDLNHAGLSLLFHLVYGAVLGVWVGSEIL